MKNNFLEFKLCDELTSCISIFSNMETKGNLNFCIEIKKSNCDFFFLQLWVYISTFLLRAVKKIMRYKLRISR